MFFGVDPFAGSSISIDKLRDEMEGQGVLAARANYLQLAVANPEDPWLALAISLLTFLNGLVPDAYVSLDKAMRALPGVWGPRIVSVSMLLQSSRIREAAQELADAEERWPEDPCVAGFAAFVFVGMRDFARADASLRRIPPEQQNEVTLTARAQLHASAAHWSESLECVESSLKLYEKHTKLGNVQGHGQVDAKSIGVMLRLLKCQLCLKLGRPEEALCAAQQACDMAGSYPDAIAARAFALCDLGKADAAIDFIRAFPESLRQSPSLALAYNWAVDITTPEPEQPPLPKKINSWFIVRRLTILPELMRVDLRVTSGNRSGPLPDSEPSLQGAFIRLRLGRFTAEVRLALPVIDTINEAVEAQGDRRLPVARVVLEIALGLYPLLIVALVLCGYKSAEQVSAWASIALITLLLIAGFGPQWLGFFYPPLLKAADVAIFGLVAALLLSLFRGDENSLAWPWWIFVVAGRLLVSSLKVRPSAIRETIAGEQCVGAFCRSTKAPVASRMLRQCVVSAFASDLEVDLTRCGLSESPAKIYLDVWFSRLTLRIRPNWSVSFVDNELAHLAKTVRAQPLLTPSAGMPSDLAIRGVLMFSRITLTF
jgi:tetratricopeptide (TPR) repeat protein